MDVEKAAIEWMRLVPAQEQNCKNAFLAGSRWQRERLLVVASDESAIEKTALDSIVYGVGAVKINPDLSVEHVPHPGAQSQDDCNQPGVQIGEICDSCHPVKVERDKVTSVKPIMVKRQTQDASNYKPTTKNEGSTISEAQNDSNHSETPNSSTQIQNVCVFCGDEVYKTPSGLMQSVRRHDVQRELHKNGFNKHKPCGFCGGPADSQQAAKLGTSICEHQVPTDRHCEDCFNGVSGSQQEQVVDLIAQALREAEARGMERAARILDHRGQLLHDEGSPELAELQVSATVIREHAAKDSTHE